MQQFWFCYSLFFSLKSLWPKFSNFVQKLPFFVKNHWNIPFIEMEKFKRIQFESDFYKSVMKFINCVLIHDICYCFFQIPWIVTKNRRFINCDPFTFLEHDSDSDLNVELAKYSKTRDHECTFHLLAIIRTGTWQICTVQPAKVVKKECKIAKLALKKICWVSQYLTS